MAERSASGIVGCRRQRLGRVLTIKQEGRIMANYRVISSDNHVFEPPDLWTSRAKPAYKDRVPKLLREYDGDWWFCEGHRLVGMAGGAQTGMRFEAPEQLVRTTTFDNIRLGGYVPEEHLKDMDADGVDVSIVYPTVGLRPCCMDRPVDAVIPCPRGLIRCGRSSGVPAPAYG
jgi:hypothetical protein